MDGTAGQGGIYAHTYMHARPKGTHLQRQDLRKGVVGSVVMSLSKVLALRGSSPPGLSSRPRPPRPPRRPSSATAESAGVDEPEEAGDEPLLLPPELDAAADAEET